MRTLLFVEDLYFPGVTESEGWSGFSLHRNFCEFGGLKSFQNRSLPEFRGCCLCPLVVQIFHLAKAQTCLFGEVRWQTTTWHLENMQVLEKLEN